MPPIKQEPKLEEESGQESDEARSESYKQPQDHPKDVQPKKPKQKNSNPDEPKWTEKHGAAPNFDNSRLLQGVKS